jgi:hypothetical protein
VRRRVAFTAWPRTAAESGDQSPARHRDSSCISDRYWVYAAALNQFEEVAMEPVKVTLCENCAECPEVEITEQGVTIGEDENTVRLSHAEWNVLVRLVKSGKLCEIGEV